MTVRTRIYLVSLFTLVGTVSYLLYWIISDLEPRYKASVEETLVDVSQVIAGIIEADLPDGTIDLGPTIDIGSIERGMKIALDRRFQSDIYEVTKERVDMRLYVTDATGTVVYDSTGRSQGMDYLPWRDVSRTLQGRYGARSTRDNPDDASSSVLYVAAPIHFQGRIIGAVTVGEPTSGVWQFMLTARSRIVTGAIFALITVLIGSVFLSLLITRPVGLVLDYFRLLQRSPEVPLPRLGRSALGILGRTFTEMREALEGRSYAERYVQTLTHEIKSPLSAIQGAAELLQEEMPAETRGQFLANIRNEAARIQLLVDKLLELAALEKRPGLMTVEKIDLSEVAQGLMVDFSPACKARGIRIETRFEPSLFVEGDPFLLRQAFSNLLQNAIDFSPDSEAIVLTLRRRGRFAEFEVLDRGPGIPAYAIASIFDRFYSLQRPRTGKKSTGLGLSFVREIAELHHGVVTVDNASERGVRAIFRLRARG